MKETKECLVDCAYLPLSIVIIGIGNEDFTKMVDLDGDLGLKDYNWRYAKRDLVQFVEFNKFKDNEWMLS